MLSLFPSFFDYSAVAVAILRIVVGIIFLMEGYKSFPKKNTSATLYKKSLSIIETVGGVFLLAGLFTQATAIILAVTSMAKIYGARGKESEKKMHLPFYFLLFAVSLSFLFFGPGLWSIDYPL